MKEEALKKAVEWAEQAKDMAVEQAPKVVEQLLVAHTIEASIWLLLGLIFVTLSVIFLKSDIFYTEEGSVGLGPEHQDHPGPMFAYIGLIGVSVIGSIMTVVNLKTILLIQFAEKYYILKEVAQMIG